MNSNGLYELARFLILHFFYKFQEVNVNSDSLIQLPKLLKITTMYAKSMFSQDVHAFNYELYGSKPLRVVDQKLVKNASTRLLTAFIRLTYWIR